MIAAIRPLFNASCILSGEGYVTRLSIFIFAIDLYNMPDVSQSDVNAIGTFTWLVSTIEPKTIIKIIGKRREKTTAVGLRNMASRLAFATAKDARNWLKGLFMFRSFSMF